MSFARAPQTTVIERIIEGIKIKPCLLVAYVLRPKLLAIEQSLDCFGVSRR
jgi:hypothetical protein